ncbi:hypothetical protein [Paenibacillus sp. OAS669]|uniref:hypothetical protein n=1 Tax=Paenibacillus sp. OAS669 TaxID=2663821 RepID=UPI00178AE97B|nr:hypothetical protein [Paenibacillus sp. OAS669]MBE1446719.1 hypothetical protein [Paenibacillus sp. OAS669]
MKAAKWGVPVLIILAFAGGYYVRGLTSGQSSGHSWVREAEPPMPAIQVNGKQVPVVRGSYSWCSGSFLQATCRSVDMISPAEIMEKNGIRPVVVPPNSMITTKAPPGIKQFTLSREGAKDNGDPYQTPAEKGIYFYHIHGEWFGDQGNAEFYFAVEVQ